MLLIAGGWLRAHPLPADKSSYGNFEALAQQNKQVVQRILESEQSTASFSGTHDVEILRKLRNLYSSCLNEERLDEIGATPLLEFVQTVRRIFKGEVLDETLPEGDPRDEPKPTDLTAAIAFLHSRGQSYASCMFVYYIYVFWMFRR